MNQMLNSVIFNFNLKWLLKYTAYGTIFFFGGAMSFDFNPI